VRKPGAGSVARAARRFRRIMTMPKTSEHANAPPKPAASATGNVVLLPGRPTTGRGREPPRVGVPVRACVRATGWGRHVRPVRLAARAGFHGPDVFATTAARVPHRGGASTKASTACGDGPALVGAGWTAPVAHRAAEGSFARALVKGLPRGAQGYSRSSNGGTHRGTRGGLERH